MRIPREFIARLELKARYPIGFDGFWSIMLKLDLDGPWTANDIYVRTACQRGTPRDYIRRLKAAGIVVQVGDRSSGRDKARQRAPLYRLTQRPLDAPRILRDGTVRPEPLIETIWRAAKMVKSFTADDLAALIEGPGGRAVNRNTIISYCDRLVGVGVMGRSGKRGHHSRYRLIQNLGARAPKVLSTKVVFDPNANAVLGTPELSEVSP